VSRPGARPGTLTRTGLYLNGAPCGIVDTSGRKLPLYVYAFSDNTENAHLPRLVQQHTGGPLRRVLDRAVACLRR
jgi:hypothetical protein